MRFNPGDQVMTADGPHTVVEPFGTKQLVAIEDLTGSRVVLSTAEVIGHPRQRCAMREVLQRMELTAIANGF